MEREYLRLLHDHDSTYKLNDTTFNKALLLFTHGRDGDGRRPLLL